MVRTPPKPDPYQLWSGETTQLRGANIYQRRVYPELDNGALGDEVIGPPYGADDFARLAALGANYVQVSHPGLFAESPPYEVDDAVVAHLDALLARIENAGLKAVIAFRTGPGRSEFTFFAGSVGTWFDASYLNDTVWTDAEAQAAWSRMWRYTAHRYRDHAAVIGYELMVEPNGEKRIHDLWMPKDFYPRYAGTLADWNGLAQALTRAVRLEDPSTPVLVSPMGFASVRWLPHLVPIDDPRVVYVVHQYAPHRYIGQAPEQNISYPDEVDLDGDGKPELFDRGWLHDLMGQLDAYGRRHGAPTAVTEFGVPRMIPEGHAFLEDQLSVFESFGMNHAIWMWHPDWSNFSRNDRYHLTRSTDPLDHQDVTHGLLLRALLRGWQRNQGTRPAVPLAKP